MAKDDAVLVLRKIEEAEKVKKEYQEKLEKASGLTRDEAKKELLSELDKELAQETSKRIRQAEENIRAKQDELSRQILVEAMRHGATDYVAEYTVSSVRLPDEEMKGRVIGREGRNIRAFERATGVEIELDETNDIRLSSFDPIRREVARRSLEALIKDGRIQPDRIEEVVSRTKKQMERVLAEEGEKICSQVGVYNLPQELVMVIGRYRFRTSYGQNLAIHTIEETKIGVAIAKEVGADANVVRLGCLLHDIGKVITDEEGSHVELGVNFLKRFDLPKEVVAAVAEHHEDKPFSSVESAIVWIADAVSSARPGARYEPHEDYAKRLTEIEETAKKVGGDKVTDSWAFQAGRELRVIVKPEAVSDEELPKLAHDIRQELEKTTQVAGQTKVVVIRESRATETTSG